MGSVRMVLVALSTVLAASVLVASPASAAFLGPSAYSSTADSPFSPFAGFSYFHLEDFDDHLLNTPGVTVTPVTAVSSATTGFSGAIIDQVGLEGGCPAGGLTVACDTWFGGGATGLTFSFDAGVLGALPNAVGIVWTDGAGTIAFTAFDEDGISLGSIGGDHADASFLGTTADDRFYGVTHTGGISSIHISNTTGGIEVDHLQYGLRSVNGHAVPEPGILTLLGLGLGAFGLSRRRKKT